MKRGKKIIAFAVISILLIGIIIAESDSGIANAISNSAIGSVGEKAKEYVGDFAEKMNIAPEKIDNITEVDFASLPKEVNIENIDDSKLDIYKVDYQGNSGDKKQVFVVTYGVEKLQSQGDLIISSDKRQFLSFGYSGEMQSGFLKTDAGVQTGAEKGYVMTRAGSITAISTNLEVLNSNGNIDIIIYKNGKAISFGNSLEQGAGVKKDYDVQSNEIVTFEAGDTISAYANGNGSWKDVITLIEVTTK